MAETQEDQVESSPPAVVEESMVQEPVIEVPVVEENAVDEDAPPIPPQSIMRTRGVVVTNLRAAFEQQGSLGPLSRPLSADSRTLAGSNRLATFDADFARLKDAMSREQTMREADKRRLHAQEEEIEMLRAHIEEIGQADNSAEIDESYLAEREDLLTALHRARAHADQIEAEANALRAQLIDLKRSISTNTRIENHEMTDSAFQGELGTLCYQLQDWSINRFCKVKVEGSPDELIARIGDECNEESKERLSTLLRQWDPACKMTYLQSILVTLLMPIFDDPMPFGLPPRADWSEAIRAASQGLSNLLDDQAYNRWRATTFDVICHSEAMSPFIHSAANKVVSQVCAIIDQITASPSSEAQIDALRNVVRRVIALSHSFRVQRAVYEVHLPEPGVDFDEKLMEDMLDDYEGPDERTIRCAVFPLVLKPNGCDIGSIIFKARIT